MSIRKILESKRTLSFEVFPPKLDQPTEPLIESLDKMEGLKPDFISVTYGAGGTNKGKNNEICQYLIDKNRENMSHFTCIGNTKAEAIARVQRYMDMGGKNLLALRGDLPKGFKDTNSDYKYGYELIEDLHKAFPHLCIAGSCYPEKHIESDSVELDVDIMNMKKERGCEFFVSQLCYDLDAFDRFLDLCDKKKVDSPILMGIMPVLTPKVILKITDENCCSRPKKLQNIIDSYGHNIEEFRKYGLEYTKELIEEYLKRDIAGIHLYTLNKYDITRELVEETSLQKLKNIPNK